MKKLLLILVLLISTANAEVVGKGILGAGTFVGQVSHAYGSDGGIALVRVKVNTDRGPLRFAFEHSELKIVRFEGKKYITFYKTTCAKKRWLGDNWKKFKGCKLKSIIKSDRGILYVETSIDEGN